MEGTWLGYKTKPAGFAGILGLSQVKGGGGIGLQERENYAKSAKNSKNKISIF
jgi:hypothetical protein